MPEQLAVGSSTVVSVVVVLDPLALLVRPALILTGDTVWRQASRLMNLSICLINYRLQELIQI